MQKSLEHMRVIKIQINEKNYVCGLEDLMFLIYQYFPTWSINLIQSLQDILWMWTKWFIVYVEKQNTQNHYQNIWKKKRKLEDLHYLTSSPNINLQ